MKFLASLFASGSMDGAVVIWQTESLTPIKVLNNPEKYRSDDRIYVYNVKHLLPLGEVIIYIYIYIFFFYFFIFLYFLFVFRLYIILKIYFCF